MVKVESNGGRLGNQMFAYAFGRLLAEHLGYALDASPVRGFPMTCRIPRGTVVAEPQVWVRDGTESLEAIAARCAGRCARLRGYFERACHYLPHIERLREWFAPAARPHASAQTILHIRATDFIRFGKMLPRDYYLQALEALGNPGDIGICTDDPRHELVQYFRARGAVIHHQHDLGDFALMMGARNLVLSLSTFAWWAAFLSEANVVQPAPAAGWRSALDPAHNLTNPAWIGIPCGHICDG